MGQVSQSLVLYRATEEDLFFFLSRYWLKLCFFAPASPFSSFFFIYFRRKSSRVSHDFNWLHLHWQSYWAGHNCLRLSFIRTLSTQVSKMQNFTFLHASLRLPSTTLTLVRRQRHSLTLLNLGPLRYHWIAVLPCWNPVCVVHFMCQVYHYTRKCCICQRP